MFKYIKRSNSIYSQKTLLSLLRIQQYQSSVCNWDVALSTFWLHDQISCHHNIEFSSEHVKIQLYSIRGSGSTLTRRIWPTNICPPAHVCASKASSTILGSMDAATLPAFFPRSYKSTLLKTSPKYFVMAFMN